MVADFLLTAKYKPISILHIWPRLKWILDQHRAWTWRRCFRFLRLSHQWYYERILKVLVTCLRGGQFTMISIFSDEYWLLSLLKNILLQPVVIVTICISWTVGWSVIIATLCHVQNLNWIGAQISDQRGRRGFQGFQIFWDSICRNAWVRLFALLGFPLLICIDVPLAGFVETLELASWLCLLCAACRFVQMTLEQGGPSGLVKGAGPCQILPMVSHC